MNNYEVQSTTLFRKISVGQIRLTLFQTIPELLRIIQSVIGKYVSHLLTDYYIILFTFHITLATIKTSWLAEKLSLQSLHNF